MVKSDLLYIPLVASRSGYTPLLSGIHIILVVGYGWSNVLLALNSLVSSSNEIIWTCEDNGNLRWHSSVGFADAVIGLPECEHLLYAPEIMVAF